MRDYVDDGEWLEAVRTITRRQEDFKQQKGLRGGGSSGATSGEKRKFADSKPPVTAKRLKKQYTPKAKAVYKAKKAGERRVKNGESVALAGEVNHTLWAAAHQGVIQKVLDQKVVDQKVLDHKVVDQNVVDQKGVDQKVVDQKVVDQKVVDKRKSDNECKPCGMKHHSWKNCRKWVQVSAMYRGPAKPKRQTAFAPTRRPLVATMAVDGQGESSK